MLAGNQPGTCRRPSPHGRHWFDPCNKHARRLPEACSSVALREQLLQQEPQPLSLFPRHQRPFLGSTFHELLELAVDSGHSIKPVGKTLTISSRPSQLRSLDSTIRVLQVVIQQAAVNLIFLFEEKLLLSRVSSRPKI